MRSRNELYFNLSGPRFEKMAECDVSPGVVIESRAAVEEPEQEVTVSCPHECVVRIPSPTGELQQEAEAEEQHEQTPTTNAPVPTVVAADEPPSTTTITATFLSKLPQRSRRQNLRRSFTTEFKLECVEHAERTKNKTETARVFNVNRRRVQEWCMQKEKLMAIPKEQKRLSGGGRKPSEKPSKEEAPKTVPGPDLLCEVASIVVAPPPDKLGGSDDAAQPGASTTGSVDMPAAVPTEPEAGRCESGLPQVSPVRGVGGVVPDSVVESIVRSLSSSDPSLLSPSLLKIIQDLSSEAMSHDARSAIVRDMAAGMLLAPLKVAESDRTPLPEGPVGGEAVVEGRDITTQEPLDVIKTSAEQHGGGEGGGRGEEVDVVMAVAEDEGHHHNGAKGDRGVAVGVADGLREGGVVMEDEDEERVLEPAKSMQAALELSEVLHTPTTNATLAPALGTMPDLVAQSATILEALMQVATSLHTTPADTLQSLGLPLTPTTTTTPSTNSTSTLAQQPPSLTTPPPATQPSLAMEIDPAAILQKLQETNFVGEEGEARASVPAEPGVLMEEGGEGGGAVASSENKVSPSGDGGSKPAGRVRSKVKKVYSLDFKLECVAHAEATSKCAAARQFKVDRRRVQDWCSQKQKLLHLKCATTEAKKAPDLVVEEQLAAWVRDQREAGRALTRRMVADEAARLFQETGNAEFTATVGWVAKFMIRNGISLLSTHLSPMQQLTPPPSSTVKSEVDADTSEMD